MAELECLLDSYIAKLDQAYESAWEVFTNREVRPSLRQLEAAYQFEFYLRRFRRLASSLPPWVLYGDALEPYSDVIALLEPAEKSGPRLCKAKKSPGGSEAPVM